ncbi:MAG: Flp family type IVb pilin [Acidobacteria bacterium]|nr:Flp family type IVb pilin [Acidobacteriota bacterium]
MQTVITMLHRLVAAEDGQDLVEYGLLVVLIAIVAIAGLTFLGSTVSAVLWEPLSNAI